jgi:hypothetical protein
VGKDKIVFLRIKKSLFFHDLSIITPYWQLQTKSLSLEAYTCVTFMDNCGFVVASTSTFLIDVWDYPCKR